jgi:hypothetical protein
MVLFRSVVHPDEFKPKAKITSSDFRPCHSVADRNGPKKRPGTICHSDRLERRNLVQGNILLTNAELRYQCHFGSHLCVAGCQVSIIERFPKPVVINTQHHGKHTASSSQQWLFHLTLSASARPLRVTSPSNTPLALHPGPPLPHLRP